MTNKTLGATSACLLSVLSQEDRTIFSVADAQRVLGTSYGATKKALRRLSRLDARLPFHRPSDGIQPFATCASHDTPAVPWF